MSGDEETAVDKNCPATLHNGAISTDFPTLLDAVMAWHRLRPEQAQKASIRIIGGELYAAAQIPKLLNDSEGDGRLTILLKERRSFSLAPAHTLIRPNPGTERLEVPPRSVI